MKICSSHGDQSPQFRRGSWLRWLLGVSASAVLAALACSDLLGQTKDLNVGKPVVSERVIPKVLARDLRQLPITRVWRPGDPVRVIRQGDYEPEQEDTQLPKQERGLSSEPATPKVLAGDLRRLPTAKAWKPGDPVRVIRQGEREPEQEESKSREEGGEVATPVVSFDGIPATGSLPPDTVGDVGPGHYIQMVNTAFAIYDKQGNLLVGPSPINSLWSGFGGPCETQNNGDPIVQYDQLADRWLLSQFAVPGGAAGFHECIAISRTSDPVAGGWFLYDFPTPVFPDYPKIGVWPDAYYMSTYEGANLGVFAFDRARMLNGNPATFVRFTISSLTTISTRARTRILPSDLDGPTPPPPGSPNFFVRSVDGTAQGGGPDRLEIFAFHVDFGNPANSTFTGPTTLPTAPYDIQMCGASLPRSCIPQPGTAQGLDPLSNRLVRQVQYRNFGTYETLVTNQTVDVGDFDDHAGIRWYELRKVGGVWSMNQQGTYFPDGAHRWMGSIAMDKAGDMALGYSISSKTVFPGIRYAGRLANDPAGTLPQGEVVLVTGGRFTNAQQLPLGRLQLDECGPEGRLYLLVYNGILRQHLCCWVEDAYQQLCFSVLRQRGFGVHVFRENRLWLAKRPAGYEARERFLRHSHQYP